MRIGRRDQSSTVLANAAQYSAALREPRAQLLQKGFQLDRETFRNQFLRELCAPATSRIELDVAHALVVGWDLDSRLAKRADSPPCEPAYEVARLEDDIPLARPDTLVEAVAGWATSSGVRRTIVQPTAILAVIRVRPIHNYCGTCQNP